MTAKFWLLIGAVLVAVALPGGISWAKPSLESRLERLENIVDSQLNTKNLDGIASLRQEVFELRGMLEEQAKVLRLLQDRSQQAQSQQQVDTSASGNTVAAQAQQVHNQSPVSVPIKLPATASEKVSVAASTQASILAQDSSQVSVTALTPSSVSSFEQTQASPEQANYDAAYNLIENKRFKEAQVAMQDFLWQFPDSKNAANVYYWLGEIYLLDWQSDKTNQLLLDKALSSFKVVAEKYPEHNKAADSLLKLGLTEIELENWSAAKDYLTEVKRKYPESSRARIANMRLEDMQQQGLL